MCSHQQWHPDSVHGGGKEVYDQGIQSKGLTFSTQRTTWWAMEGRKTVTTPATAHYGYADGFE